MTKEQRMKDFGFTKADVEMHTRNHNWFIDDNNKNKCNNRSLNTNSQTDEIDYNYPFPSTRYQGSKYKVVEWIWENIKDIPFNSALDAFGGTGCVSHMLKRKGKCVTYNDILKFNCIIGKALVENDVVKIDNEDIEFILNKHENIEYPTFIQDNFKNIFYLDEENAWLDMVVKNIHSIDNEYKQSIAWFALFQSCIIKRPYSLFHRANLYFRTSEVNRSFGNKTTWDKPFEQHFINFINEANEAIFSNGTQCKSSNYDALNMPDDNYDLVYIDTPYISNKGVGVDYIDFYHFLEGMVDYNNWNEKLLKNYKHLPIKGKGENVWIKKKQIYDAFEELIKKYKNSILVISYRGDGIPSENEIKSLLEKHKKNVSEVRYKAYKYALSHKKTSEILFIAE